MKTTGKTNDRKRTAFAALLAVVIVLPLFIGLGFWQLQRAEVKRELQAEYDRRAQDKPVTISSQRQAASDLRFYTVEVSGHYERNYEILLDNRVHHGRVGYFVLTPLRIRKSNMHVLINRGWVPQGETRDKLPATPVPGGEISVKGLATVPSKGGYRLGPPMDDNKVWQTVWQYLDMELVDKKTPFPIQPVVVLLDPKSQAGGFTREWQRLDAGIAVHQGYAFQWFSLAVAVAAVYLFLMFRFRRQDKQDKQDN